MRFKERSMTCLELLRYHYHYYISFGGPGWLNELGHWIT